MPTTSICTTTCTYYWTGDAWQFIYGGCEIGCQCVEPAMPADGEIVFIGEERSTTCEPLPVDSTTTTTTSSSTTTTSSSTTTSSTCAPGQQGVCIYTWDGTAWVANNQCCPGYVCGNAPSYVASNIGDTVHVPCVEPTSTTTTTSSTSSTSTSSTSSTTTTTTTAAPCTGGCTWRWSAAGSTWLKYGRGNCSTGCSCQSPTTPGTVDGEYRTVSCGRLTCQACCGVPVCCPVTDCCATNEWPRRLFVTIHDPDNTCGCLDGLSFQLDLIATDYANLSAVWRYRPECGAWNQAGIACNEQTAGCATNYWFSPVAGTAGGPSLVLYKSTDSSNINQGLACDLQFDWYLSPNADGWTLPPDPERRHHIFTIFNWQYYNCQRPINISSKVFSGGVWINQGTKLNRTEIVYGNTETTLGCYAPASYPVNTNTIIPGMYMTITE